MKLIAEKQRMKRTNTELKNEETDINDKKGRKTEINDIKGRTNNENT